MIKIKKIKKKISFLAIVAGVILFSFPSLTRRANAAADAVLTFNPSSTTVTNGATFSIGIMINPGSHQISNADLALTFDAARLNLTSVTNLGSPFSVIQGSAIGTGTLVYSAGTAMGSNVTLANLSPATTAIYATLNFTALATGSPVVSIGASTAFYADDEPGINQLFSTNVNTTVTISATDTTSPTFTAVDGVSASWVKSDTINYTVADATGVASQFYGFSTDGTCNSSDTIDTAFISGTNFTISGNHNDYLCLKATDTAAIPNIGYQLAGQLHVDNTAPTNQNTVFAASATKKGSAATAVVSSADATNAIWFAPSGTTTFTAGATMTTAGGTATSILAPATAGAYRMFVVDAAGNISTQSTAILTVDNTLPVVTTSVAVPGTGKITTPHYTFTSSKAGAITYGGSCSSSSTAAILGSNEIVFNALVPGTYSNCTIQITDVAGNQNAALLIPQFIILWPADLDGTSNGVDGADYSILHANYNPFTAQPGNAADINGDTYVNGADYSFLHAQYGRSY